MDIQENKLSLLPKPNIFVGINNYKNELSISQVVTFFERNNIQITKTMIQNYVRNNVIPEVYEKRFYTRKHIVLLSLINDFKSIYSLEEIKQCLYPILNNKLACVKDNDDLLILYDIYINMCNKLDFNTCDTNKIEKELIIILSEVPIEDTEKKQVCNFLSTLLLMKKTVYSKEISIKYINNECLLSLHNI